MIKKFSFILIILIMMILSSCKNPENKEVQSSNSSNNSSSLIVDKISNISSQNLVEKAISKYVDSINVLTPTSPLPAFLKNPQFDYRNRGLWNTLHTPISVRNAIINRVVYCNALKMILAKQDGLIKKRPVKEDDIEVPLSDKSFYDLILEREKALQCP